jgi:CubicO group peptidase (beta-lactamase class C family)
VGTRIHEADAGDLDDRFHLGSNTKSMTATLAGMLVEEGRLGWGSTVGEVLGREVPGLSASLAGATLAQLLSHASGIPGDTEDMLALYFNGNPFDYNPPALRLRTLDAWKRHVVTVPKGSPFQYSNFSYMIAGSMIEKAAGTPWEQLMDDRIFVPMGMPTARLGPPGMPICRSAITPNGPVGTPARQARTGAGLAGNAARHPVDPCPDAGAPQSVAGHAGDRLVRVGLEHRAVSMGAPAAARA